MCLPGWACTFYSCACPAAEVSSVHRLRTSFQVCLKTLVVLETIEVDHFSLTILIHFKQGLNM